MAVERPKMRKRVVARLSREEETRLITHAYRMKGERGLFIKKLFQTGARVSEFVNIQAEDVFFEEQMILLRKPRAGRVATSPPYWSRPGVADAQRSTHRGVSL